jgi:hypothetical protein
MCGCVVQRTQPLNVEPLVALVRSVMCVRGRVIANLTRFTNQHARLQRTLHGIVGSRLFPTSPRPNSVPLHGNGAVRGTPRLVRRTLAVSAFGFSTPHKMTLTSTRKAPLAPWAEVLNGLWGFAEKTGLGRLGGHLTLLTSGAESGTCNRHPALFVPSITAHVPIVSSRREVCS